jgi:hypothetical protein
LSNDGKTLYWQPLTGRTLYRIATDVLMSDDPEEAGRKVEKAGMSCVADGLLMTRDGTADHLARGQFDQAVGGRPRPHRGGRSQPALARFHGRGAGRLDLRHRLAHPGQRLVQQGRPGGAADQALSDDKIVANKYDERRLTGQCLVVHMHILKGVQ